MGELAMEALPLLDAAPMRHSAHEKALRWYYGQMRSQPYPNTWDPSWTFSWQGVPCTANYFWRQCWLKAGGPCKRKESRT